MTKKQKEELYRQQWHKNRSMIYHQTFSPLLNKKRALEYNAKLKEYAEFLKGDLESNHFSILQLLRFKIAKNYSYIKRHQTRPDFDAKKIESMKATARLLTEVEESDFGLQASLKKMEAKWKPIRKRYLNNLPPKLLAKSNAEFKKISLQAHKKRKAALSKAFSLITENIWNWWDEEYAGDETAISGRVEFPPGKTFRGKSKRK